MDTLINKLINVLTPQLVLYIVIALVVIIVLTIVLRGMRKRSLKGGLVELETKYNEVKGIPLAFKFNKAVALSRVNEAMLARVNECQPNFDSVQEALKECGVLLAEADDLLYVHKNKAAYKKMEQLQKNLEESRKKAEEVNQVLDEILEQESEQRSQINILKERFRSIKKMFGDNRNAYHQSVEYIEKRIDAIEKKFSLFEEWMFASEFDKAHEQQEEIAKDIQELGDQLHALPNLYEQARGVLPKAIDEIGLRYAQTRNKGVYLEHLDVQKNLDIISDQLKENIAKLRGGIVVDVKENLNALGERLLNLQDLIAREDDAYAEIHGGMDELFQKVRHVNEEFESIVQLYQRVNERFGFEDWSARLKEEEKQLEQMNVLRRKVEKTAIENVLAASAQLMDYRELAKAVELFGKDVEKMKAQLTSACSDEERAKKQLVKLQLILNEVRLKTACHRLPSISSQYQSDLAEGEKLINRVKLVLEHSPLDVQELNADLQEAIDFVYKLYNNANNLVGIAIMVENAIVFGNRYRSSYSEIDSELTRAELSFQNGEYTKALKIAIQCIEKMHPGIYEKLIKTNDPSIMNQVG